MVIKVNADRKLRLHSKASLEDFKLKSLSLFLVSTLLIAFFFSMTSKYFLVSSYPNRTITVTRGYNAEYIAQLGSL